MRPINRRFAFVAFVVFLGLGACGTFQTIPGTTVADTPTNKDVLKVCEDYRHAMLERDAAKLLTLASPRYYEDSGTPKGDDDYGYEGLKQVLATRLQNLRAVRYDIEYRSIEVSGKRAKVDIRYDASFQLATDMGDKWERKQNEKRIELERDDGGRWLITSGM